MARLAMRFRARIGATVTLEPSCSVTDVDTAALAIVASIVASDEAWTVRSRPAMTFEFEIRASALAASLPLRAVPIRVSTVLNTTFCGSCPTELKASVMPIATDDPPPKALVLVFTVARIAPAETAFTVTSPSVALACASEISAIALVSTVFVAMLILTAIVEPPAKTEPPCE